MFNKAKKIIAGSMLLSLVVGSTALAAYPNMYGKNYTKTKSGDICSMTAEGNQESAKTKIKNTAGYTNFLDDKFEYTVSQNK